MEKWTKQHTIYIYSTLLVLELDRAIGDGGVLLKVLISWLSLAKVAKREFYLMGRTPANRTPSERTTLQHMAFWSEVLPYSCTWSNMTG